MNETGRRLMGFLQWCNVDTAVAAKSIGAFGEVLSSLEESNGGPLSIDDLFLRAGVAWKSDTGLRGEAFARMTAGAPFLGRHYLLIGEDLYEDGRLLPAGEHCCDPSPSLLCAITEFALLYGGAGEDRVFRQRGKARRLIVKYLGGKPEAERESLLSSTAWIQAPLAYSILLQWDEHRPLACEAVAMAPSAWDLPIGGREKMTIGLLAMRGLVVTTACRDLKKLLTYQPRLKALFSCRRLVTRGLDEKGNTFLHLLARKWGWKTRRMDLLSVRNARGWTVAHEIACHIKPGNRSPFEDMPDALSLRTGKGGVSVLEVLASKGCFFPNASGGEGIVAVQSLSGVVRMPLYDWVVAGMLKMAKNIQFNLDVLPDADRAGENEARALFCRNYLFMNTAHPDRERFRATVERLFLQTAEHSLPRAGTAGQYSCVLDEIAFFEPGKFDALVRSLRLDDLLAAKDVEAGMTAKESVMPAGEVHWL